MKCLTLSLKIVVENMLQAGASKGGLSMKDLLIRGMLSGVFLGYATTLAITAITQTGMGVVGALVFPWLCHDYPAGAGTGDRQLRPDADRGHGCRTTMGKLAFNWTWVLTGNLMALFCMPFCITSS